MKETLHYLDVEKLLAGHRLPSSRRTVNALVQRGELNPKRYNYHTLAFDRADVLRFIKRRKEAKAGSIPTNHLVF